MNLQEELRINGHQPVAGCAGTEIGEFFEAIVDRNGNRGINNNIYFLLSQAYTYGVIQGKRAERARRRRKNL